MILHKCTNCTLKHAAEEPKLLTYLLGVCCTISDCFSPNSCSLHFPAKLKLEWKIEVGMKLEAEVTLGLVAGSGY